MTTELAVVPMEASTLNALVLAGDLSKLTEAQMSAYYVYRCNAVGLDPATKPFDVLTLNGKKVLYATKECSSQLSHRDKLTVQIVSTQVLGGVYQVTARAQSPDGRFTDDIGAVAIEGLKGDALCNAYMKCSTKGKRRAILTHCGLGMLDETEIETIPASAKGASTAIQQTMQKRTNAEIVAEMNTHTAKESTPALQTPNKASSDEKEHAAAMQREQEAEHRPDPQKSNAGAATHSSAPSTAPRSDKPYAGYHEFPLYYVFWVGTPKQVGQGTKIGVGFCQSKPVGGKKDPSAFFADVWTSNDGGGERMEKINAVKGGGSRVHVLLSEKPSKTGGKPFITVEEVEHEDA